MNRLVQTLVVFIIGTGLVWAGFYLTGVAVARVDHRAIGLSASAAYVPLMFLAWGLPALFFWLVAAFFLKHCLVRSALICAAVEVEVFVVLAGSWLLDTQAGAPNTSISAELSALFETLFPPCLFILLLSPAGALLGARLRFFIVAGAGRGAAR